MRTPEMVTLGIGIALSLIYAWRTGLGCGGLVSAGMLALSLHSPERLLSCLVVSSLIVPPLGCAVRRWGLHGRARVGWAMMMSLAVRIAAGAFFTPVPWVGWVVPALLAADMQRQGYVETLSAAVTVTCLTGLLAQTALHVWSVYA